MAFALHCSGGLGNRLLGLLSAKVKFPDGPIFVYWPRGPFSISKAHPQLEANFEDLYQRLPNVQFVGYDEFVGLRKEHKYGYSHGALPNTATLDLMALRGLLKLATRPQALVDDFLKTHDLRTTIGCLVRTKGHLRAASWSPAARFTQLVQKIPPQLTVFAAFDDPSWVRSVTRPVVSFCKEGQLGSMSHLVAAAAEMEVLSKTALFYAPPATAMAVFVQLLRGQSLRADLPIGPWAEGSNAWKEINVQNQSTKTESQSPPDCVESA